MLHCKALLFSPSTIIKRAFLALAWLLALAAPAALAHAAPLPHALQIQSITVCSPTGLGGKGSCPSGTYDTHQTVIAPNGQSINDYLTINNYGGLGGISDEHASIFAPGTLDGNTDYVFFVGTRSSVNSDTGVVALSGGKHPTPRGRWVLNIPYADGYGFYNFPPSLLTYFGQLFLSPVGRDCPTVADGNAAHQDQTFDLNYAAAGSIVKDPTGPAGHLLMIYEGTNTCFGTTGGSRIPKFYSTTGIATSFDYGHSWPT